jgi:hypothetical protein
MDTKASGTREVVAGWHLPIPANYPKGYPNWISGKKKTTAWVVYFSH